jgi:ribosome-associated protein
LRKTKASRDPLEVAEISGALALSKKADDVIVLDLRKVSAAADYFVIVSAGTDVQVKAVSDAVVEGLDKAGIPVWHIEGYGNRRWVLIDLIDVVVHVFHREAREFYGLERLWGDAPVRRLV